jgi:hypothetical protein
MRPHNPPNRPLPDPRRLLLRTAATRLVDRTERAPNKKSAGIRRISRRIPAYFICNLPCGASVVGLDGYPDRATRLTVNQERGAGDRCAVEVYALAAEQ